MGVELPEIHPQEFAARIRACCPEPLAESQVERLYLHYSELRRWNPRVSLVGPVASEVVVERHYGESLAALPLLSRSGVLLDVGSGGGFPGLVLAVARPGMEVTLVESRGRKWSFLMSVCRAAALSCNCLNARVGTAPDEGLPRKPIDCITTRAVRFEDLGLSVLLPRLAKGGSLLLWSGVESPDLPRSLRILREIPLGGSRHRRVLEIVNVEGSTEDE